MSRQPNMGLLGAWVELMRFADDFKLTKDLDGTADFFSRLKEKHDLPKSTLNTPDNIWSNTLKDKTSLIGIPGSTLVSLFSNIVLAQVVTEKNQTTENKSLTKPSLKLSCEDDEHNQSIKQIINLCSSSLKCRSEIYQVYLNSKLSSHISRKDAPPEAMDLAILIYLQEQLVAKINRVLTGVLIPAYHSRPISDETLLLTKDSLTQLYKTIHDEYQYLKTKNLNLHNLLKKLGAFTLTNIEQFERFDPNLYRDKNEVYPLAAPSPAATILSSHQSHSSNPELNDRSKFLMCIFSPPKGGKPAAPQFPTHRRRRTQSLTY